MRVSEEIKIFWNQLTGMQQVKLVAPVVIILGLLVCASLSSLSAWAEVRRYEREAARAKQEAKEHLDRAAKIALEKLEVEKTLAELEAKRDGKQTEAERVHIEVINARAEYVRAVRERRGDDPSSEQLCTELRALGYPC
jgi:hypothetical protein